MSAIAPITGRFQRRVLFNIIGSLVAGVACANLFWYKHHIPKMEGWKSYDAKVKVQVEQENAAYFASLGAAKSEE